MSPDEKRQQELAKRREYQRQYVAENRERVRENTRKWRAENRDKINAYKRARNADPVHREWILGSKRTYRQRHYEKVLAYNREYARRRAAAGRMTLKAVGEALESALGKNTLYAAAVAAVPRSLPRDVRMDVVSAIVLAVLEGEISEAQIPANAQRFVTAHYRMFDQHKTRSLDEPMAGSEKLRLGDTIAADAFHF